MDSDICEGRIAEQGKEFDLLDLKVKLVNLVCASMICEPKFEGKDAEITNLLRFLVQEVAKGDPEFILKMALYVRDDLNIRTTANFLLALAANIEACTPFLKKYFRATIKLPSDWLAVASMYQKLPDRALQGRALPTALRKAMQHKFSDFDAYQLAKYNKEGKAKRKAKKIKKGKAEQNKKGGKSKEKEPEKRPELPSGKKELTMKQMIRLLHISEPVDHVMCILGKRYPSNEQDFQRSKLTGKFDPQRAGKRMKLPVPETWETLVSAKGNKAETWEELIDHKKLPFMAMLRNLRNLILAGVSHRHHSWVLSKLTNEGAISNSKQFPFRFFSAYDAVEINITELKKDIQEEKERLASKKGGKKPMPKGKPKGKGKKDEKTGRKKKVIIPKFMPDDNLIKKYRAALDCSVKYATIHNIKPIRGSTAVFCSVAEAMRQECKTARGMGAIKKTDEVGILLGLMCKYMCEECDFLIFSSPGSEPKCYLPVDLLPGTILDNMKVVQDLAGSGSLGQEQHFPFEYIETLICQRKKIDNLIVLSNSVDLSHEVKNILKKYRQEVNPDLLFVNVNLGASAAAISAMSEEQNHPNDVQISGFSDAILRYVAERGDGNQIQYIQHIDQVKALQERVNLPKLAGLKISTKKKEPKASAFWSFLDPMQACKFQGCDKKFQKQKLDAHMVECEYRPGTCCHPGCDEELPVNLLSQHQARCPFQQPKKAKSSGKWRTARLFVSSTFLDMHGERDILARTVFPELRERCKKRKINFYDLDLRWGVTREEAENNSAPLICLNEVDRCRPFFLGLLGERYGWVPTDYGLPDAPQFDWVKKFPKGRSITELEMWYGALLNPAAAQALFYFRDPSFMSTIPPEQRTVFDTENDDARQKIQHLKDKIKERCPNKAYTCQWGMVDNKVVTTQLGEFAQMILEDLWAAICREFPEQDIVQNPLLAEREAHETFQEARAKNFVGRRDVLNQLFKYTDSDQLGPMVVFGKPGDGKTSLLAYFATEYSRARPGAFVLSHFIGSAPGSSDARKVLYRLCSELKSHFNLKEEVPEELAELSQAFPRFLDQASLGSKVVLVIDSLNKLTPASLDWLPSLNNSSIRLVVSGYTGSKAVDSLKLRRPSVPLVELAPLDQNERADLVRQYLWEFRKKLDETPSNNQMRALSRKIDSGKPLFLVLACEELRIFGSYEQLNNRISKLAGNLNKLFEEILIRLDNDFGPVVKHLFSLIACSREGLLETEAIALLGKKTPMPWAAWSKLFGAVQHLLRPIVDSGNGMMSFFHEQLTQAISKRYLGKPDGPEQVNIHKAIATYFSDLVVKGETIVREDYRALSELPYHLNKAKMTKELFHLLCNLNFVEAKASAGLVFDLVADYHLALGLPERSKVDPKGVLDEFFKFVSQNTHILSTEPELTFQLAANQPDESSPSKFASSLWLQAKGSPWVRWINKPQEHDPCMMTMSGNPEPVMACAYSPDGRQIVIAGRDRTLKIKDAKSGNELATLVGHSNWVVACAYSPTGSQIVSASWDGTLKVWDVSTATEVFTLVGHSRRVSGCCYSHDGKLIASASWDCTLRLWDSSEGKLLKVLSGHTKPVNACSFAPDDQRVVSASWDATIKIWDVPSGKEALSLSGHTKSVRSVEFSPNGRLIVSTSADCTIRVWDALTGAPTNTLEGHSMPVNSCAFSFDGKQLVSASDDQTIKVWDVLGGREVAAFHSPTSIAFSCCAFSPNGRRAAAAQADCTVSVWDILTGTEVWSSRGHTQIVNNCAFSPGGKLLLTASDDATLRLWDAAHGAEAGVLSGHKGAVNDCCFSSDGAFVLSCSDDFSVRLWDVKSKKLSRTMPDHSAAVRSCTFSPNGKLVASAAKDGLVFVWQVSNGNLLHRLSGHKDWVNCLTISPDSSKLLTGSWDYTLKMWSLSNGKELISLNGHQSAVTGCEISPDSQRIVSSSLDGTLKIWNADDGSCINTLDGHTSRVNDCSISKDGKTIISASDDSTLRLWDAVAGTEISTLQGHSGVIRSIAFAPETRQVMSASEDCTVKVWDPLAQTKTAVHSEWINGCAISPNGQNLVTATRGLSLQVWSLAGSLKKIDVLEGHTQVVNSCVYSPSGRQIVSASDDGTLRLWNPDDTGSSETLSGHSNAVKDCAFSSRNVIVSASWDNTLRLWSSGGDELKTLNGHSDWVNTCSFSSDGLSIASGSHDQTVKLWKADAGVCFATLEGHTNWVHSCAFSPVSNIVVSGSFDTTAKLWDVRAKTAVINFNAHSARVNCTQFTTNGKFIITTSHDQSIKVWDIAMEHRPIMKFYAKAPVTALVVGPNGFIGGDSLGNLYHLEAMF